MISLERKFKKNKINKRKVWVACRKNLCPRKGSCKWSPVLIKSKMSTIPKLITSRQEKEYEKCTSIDL